MQPTRKDTPVLTLSKEYSSDTNITNLIEQLRDESIQLASEQNISLSDCYPELTHNEDEITLMVYRRV